MTLMKVDTFSKTKKTGPETELAPYLEHASDAGFDPGNSVRGPRSIQLITYVENQ